MAKIQIKSEKLTPFGGIFFWKILINEDGNDKMM